MLSFARGRDFVLDKFNKLKKDFDEAPPAIRDLFPAGYAVVADEWGKRCAFVFERYELRLAQMTEGRTAEDKDKIDAFYDTLIQLGNKKERLEVEGIVRQEIESDYNHCYNERKPIPSAISKLQAEYYLRDLDKVGFRIIEVNGIKPNVDLGPSSKNSKIQEKIAHYTAQWISWSLSLSLAFATAMTVGFWLAPFVFAITYFAKKSGNDFGMYDVAEELLRSAGWALNKKLGWEGKLDRTKALKTLGYGIAIVASSLSAGYAAWVGTLFLPGWGFLASVLPSAIMSALKVGIPGYFAAIAGIATFAGSMASTRFFCTLSPWDNQIPFMAITLDEHKTRFQGVVNRTECWDDILKNKLTLLIDKAQNNSSSKDVIETEVKKFTKELRMQCLSKQRSQNENHDQDTDHNGSFRHRSLRSYPLGFSSNSTH